MKCSVIIPAFNAGETIRKCLESVFNSDFKDFEVIVVDDASTDDTLKIAQEFPAKIIKIKHQRGKSYARNTGASHARNIGEKKAECDILVFIDSDIVIGKDTLGKIVTIFEKRPEITSIAGVLSKTHSNKNYFSQYKNLYMNYILNKCPEYVDFIYGSCCAIRKEHFESYDLTYTFGQDTELGARLSVKGHKMLLDKDIQVVHLKKHSFLSFVRNDFIIPYYWSRLFIEQRKWKGLLKRKRVFHARGAQLLSIIVSFLLLLSVFINSFMGIFFFLCFLSLNAYFFLFLYKERGFTFMIRSVFITLLDMFVMGIGVIFGFAACIKPKRNKQING